MATPETTTPSILRPLVEELRERRERIRLGGGEEKIAKQHGAGKLTARERIDLLIDQGTFVELGMHGRPHFSQRSMEGKEAPADGADRPRLFARRPSRDHDSAARGGDRSSGCLTLTLAFRDASPCLVARAFRRACYD